jgi:hypothetical protein
VEFPQNPAQRRAYQRMIVNDKYLQARLRMSNGCTRRLSVMEATRNAGRDALCRLCEHARSSVDHRPTKRLMSSSIFRHPKPADRNSPTAGRGSSAGGQDFQTALSLTATVSAALQAVKLQGPPPACRPITWTGCSGVRSLKISRSGNQ